MRGELKVTAGRKPDGSVRVGLEGSLDAHTMPQVEAAFKKLAAENVLWIVLDLTRMQYISSVGLNFIVVTRVSLRKQGGDLLIVGPQPQVVRILKMLGLTEFLLVFPTLKAAWQDVKERRQGSPKAGE